MRSPANYQHRQVVIGNYHPNAGNPSRPINSKPAMGTNTSIEWTESTWNPVTGCTKISAGCAHCYAERMTYRLQAMGQPNYQNGFELTTHEHTLVLPLSWKKPQSIFVNSMSDLFHADVSTDFILRVFEVMKRVIGIDFRF